MMDSTYRDLVGKRILVTGGASGLGFAMARAFANVGALVLVISRNEEKLAAAAKELGANASTLACDLTHIADLPGRVKEIRRTFGEVDVLVNNAGMHLKKDALDVSDQEFGRIVLTNQSSVFALTREVGATMVERKSGSIIMISSMATFYGIPKVVAYTASKSAVEGMTRALAVEWSPFGVRINCIAPGFIATAMSAKALDGDPQRKERVLARTPMRRLGEPADVAEAALFLASERAKFITGVVLPVDGGNSIGF